MLEHPPGFVINASSSSAASCRPSTNFAYSSCSLDASVRLILVALGQSVVDEYVRQVIYSSILSPNRVTLLAAESNIGRVRSILSDSIQTLSRRYGSAI